MSIILNDPRFIKHLQGLMRSAGRDVLKPMEHEAPVRASLLGFGDDVSVKVNDSVASWIDDNCETVPQLRYDYPTNVFYLGFASEADAVIFRLTYP